MPEIAYKLLLDGQAPDPDLLATIEQIEVEDHADLADMLRLRVAVSVSEDEPAGPPSTTAHSLAWRSCVSRR